MRPACAEPNASPAVDELLVRVHRHLGRDVELVAQLAEIGDPDAQRARETEVDLARGPERERLVRQVDARERSAAARVTEAPGC